MATRLYLNSETINGALLRIGLANSTAIKRAFVKGKDFQATRKALDTLTDEDLECIKSINVNYKQQTISMAFESKTDALYKLAQNLGLTRGKDDRDRGVLIIEQVVETEVVDEAPAGGITKLSEGLEADFTPIEE